MRVDLILNEVRYEYDIRGLILSFFPGCQTITTSGDAIDEADSLIRMTASAAAACANAAWSFHYTDETVMDTDCTMYQYLADQMDDSAAGEAGALGRKADPSGRGADSSCGEADPSDRESDPEGADDRRLLIAVHYLDGAAGAACVLKTGREITVSYKAGCMQPGIRPETAALPEAAAAAQADGRKAEPVVIDKNIIKRIVYRMFSNLSGGKELPWGTLSGIRPVKLPMALLEAGKDDQEIAAELKDRYLIGQEKCGLSIDIAHREAKLLEKIDYVDGYSLYIGIPFCPTTCLYCSFTSYPFERFAGKMEAYIEALEKEIHYVQEHFRGKKLNTIYFGGGTPTTLPPQLMDRLLRDITEGFDLSDLCEWTVEGGRPDSITPEKLEVLRRYPVDRISINPQTMKQETLDIIGRRHTVEDVRRAFAMARDAGFDNINMDLIIGLPGEHAEDVAATMEEIENMDPDNLTVHTLAIKRASHLNMDRDLYGHLYLEQNTEEMMRICAEGAARMHMNPYYLYRQKNMSGNLENVGYAREGKEGVYNILIMEERQSILALGAGAVTKRVRLDGLITRAANVKSIENYLERTDEMIQRKIDLFSES